MLRIYFLQPWFNRSDPTVEEALYDSSVMRGFVDMDLGCEAVPGRDHGVQVPTLAGTTRSG
jgi:transposase, IS5 family